MATSRVQNHEGSNVDVGAYAAEIANMMSFSMVMKVAIELNVLEVIAGAESLISATEIANLLPASDKEHAAGMLERILRVLAAFAVVTCSVDGGGCRVYGLAPVATYFVRHGEDASFGPYMDLVQDEVSISSWKKVQDAVLDGGIPFNKAYGMDYFEYTRLHPKYNKSFHMGMESHSSLVMREILQHYKGFENLKQLVDVGGSVGHTLKIILLKYPTLKAINYDLPYVIEKAPNIPGIEFVSGDMFASVPSPAEAILLKCILHDWSDEQCVKLLKNCCKALPKNGKAIFLKDVLMMTLLLHGKERTMKEFTSLATAAGFTTVKFACYACNYCVMEFCK